MAENQIVAENKDPVHVKVWKAVKEWGRKQIVSLKRSPQRITLIYLTIICFINLIFLFTYSQAVDTSQESVEWTGIAVFINILFSILVLPLFLSAFPKRKKPNYVFIGLVFVFLLLIILTDVLYYVKMSNFFSTQPDNYFNNAPFLKKSLTLSISHMVLVGIGIVLLATLPLYKKLILKINTKKVIEENKLSEEIDTSEEV